MSTPELSICIPCSSRPAQLQRLLKSLTLTTVPYKVLVANTTPRDAPAKVHDAYKNVLHEYRIAQAIELPSAGPSQARHELGQLVETEYTLYLDEDLVVRQGNIEGMITFLDANKEVMISSGQWLDHVPVRTLSSWWLRRHATRLRDTGFTYVLGYPEGSVVFKKPIRISPAFTCPVILHDLQASLMIRTRLLEKHRFDPNYRFYMELYDFFFGLYRDSVKCICLPSIIFDHYPGGYQHTSNREGADRARAEAVHYFEKKWGVTPLF